MCTICVSKGGFTKQTKKITKKQQTLIYVFSRFLMDLGTFLDGFWSVFGKILEGFGMDF